MSLIKCNFSIETLIVFILSLYTSTSKPLGLGQIFDPSENVGETHYPNGTVIGKYAYLDKEGNPVKLKYFADGSSYGVELQSYKISDSTTSEGVLQETKLDYYVHNTGIPTGKKNELSKNFHQNDGNNKISKDDFEKLKLKVIKKVKYNPEYEIFTQNELNTENKCNNEKVHVYLDRTKRKAKQEFDVAGTCEQY